MVVRSIVLMIRLARSLRSLRVSGAALLSKRAVVFSSREAIAQQFRKSLATGSVVLFSRKLGVVNNMDDRESKGAPEQPAGSEGERSGEEEVVPSRKNDEEKQKSGLASTSPEEKEEKEEGVPEKATSVPVSNEDNKMDGVEMAAEPSRETDGTIIGEDKSKTDTKMTTATLVEDKTGNEVDKTPPPEEDDESTMITEDTSQMKDDKRQAGTHPQKQGGFSSFLTSPVASMRRWFSQEPKRDRQYYENLTLEEKRKLYKCGRDFVSLDDIPTWEEYRKKNLKLVKKQPLRSTYPPNTDLNKKVSLWQGDITKLEIDAIVNAANSSLLGGGGVDGAIHRAAGYSLKDECATLGGCDTGDAKITSGHRLPAKYVLHTVGPMNCSDSKLCSCYQRCFQLTLENSIRSVAFSCIATGVYGFPNEDAAQIALKTTREWLETNADKVDRVIFCVFLKVDREIYSNLLQRYFPADERDTDLDSDTKDPVVVAEGSPADKPLPSPGEKEDAPTPSLERSITEPVSTTVAGTSASDSTVKSEPSAAAAAEPSNTLKSEGTEETANGEEGEEMEVSDSCTSPNKKPKTE